MEFEIASSTDTTTVTEIRKIRLDVTSDDIYTSDNGAEWLPHYVYLEYVRIDGGPWKIQTAILWANNLRLDGQPGKQRYKETFVKTPKGRDERFHTFLPNEKVLSGAILANWPEEK